MVVIYLEMSRTGVWCEIPLVNLFEQTVVWSNSIGVIAFLFFSLHRLNHCLFKFSRVIDLFCSLPRSNHSSVNSADFDPLTESGL